MINTGVSFPVYEPLTGWVQVFFPYLIDPRMDRGFGDRFDEAQEGQAKKQLRRNTGIANYLESYQKKVNVTNFEGGRDKGRRDWAPPQGTGHGIKLELFPPAMSSAPFKY